MVCGNIPCRVRMGCYKFPVTVLVTEATEVTVNENEQLTTDRDLGQRVIDACHAKPNDINSLNCELAAVLVAGLDFPMTGMRDPETMAHMRKRVDDILTRRGF